MTHILAPLALALAVVCIAWGTWPTRKYNRRSGLGAPNPECIGTREQRYMRTEPATRSIS